ncbi:MAG: hypothetical protein EBS07_06475 [Sphingobacteriia bacterium]|nr:hypothetical protein [Sphingobacteriia bacterium]
MWHLISRFILKNRIFLLVLVGITTIIMTWFATRTELSHDFAKVIPADDPEYKAYLSFKQEFGEDGNVLIIGLESPNLFRKDVYKSLYVLTEDLKSFEGVDQVLSITHLYQLEKNESLKRFDFGLMAPVLPVTQEETNLIRKKIFSQPLYRHLILDAEGNATILAVTLNRYKLDSQDKIRIVKNITERINRFGFKNKVKIHFSGLPYIRAYTSEKIPKELTIFLLLAVVVTTLSLYLFFRSFSAVIFPLILLGIGIVWTMGLIALLGFKMTLLTGLIPPLIVVISIPNSVYLISKYHSEYRRCKNKIKALVNVIHKIGIVTLMINANTAVGFLTLYFTEVVPLQEFGLIACLATMITYVISIVLIPGVFSLLPPPSEKNTQHLDGKFIRQFISIIKNTVRHKRTSIYILTGLATGISIWGLFQLKAITYMVDDLPKEDQIYTDLRFMESHFKGVMPFEIIVDTKKNGGLRKTQILRKIEQLQEKLETYPEISKTRSVVDLFKTARMAFYGNNPEEFSLPSRDEMNFILSYYRRQTGGVRKKNIMSAIVDTTFRKTRISGNIKDIGSIEMKILMTKVEKDIAEIFDKPEETETLVTGTTKIFIKANDYLVSNLFWSLIATFLLIAAQMYWLFKSWKVMVVSMLANLIPLIIIGGIMGFSGIPLKPSTVLIFGIAFGIAIDNTIHYLAKYRQDRKMGLNVMDSVMLSLDETGQGIIYTSLILLCGFIIFVASSFGSTVALGVLTSLTLFIALFSNLLFLPAMVITLNIQENSSEVLIDEYNENDD